MDAATTLDVGLAFNAATIVLSLAAVVYWVRLFKRMSLSKQRDEGWLWIFASVLLVLLLNVSAMLLVLSSGRVPLGVERVFVVDEEALEFVNSFSRISMALSMAVGAYLLNNSMRQRQGVKYEFTPVEPQAEEPSESAAKYELKAGKSYLITQGTRNGRDHYIKTEHPDVSAIELFADLVTHGTMGLAATRTYPPQLRKKYGLVKTPIRWLTQEKTYDESIHPADLIELSHVIKDFIGKGGETVVLVDGLEYLMLHNSFEDVLKTLQGLDDVVAQNNSRMIVSVDPAAFTDQQFHLLSRELTEYPGARS